MEYFILMKYFLPTLLILIAIVSISQQNSYILAYSPSSSLIAVAGEPLLKMRHCGSFTGLPYMESTSFTSDGRTLYATIWLSSPLHANQSYEALAYGIEVYIDDYSGNFSHSNLPYYNVYIQQQKNGTWTKNGVEYDPIDYLSLWR